MSSARVAFPEVAAPATGGTVLVYRDRIVPKSEAQFMRRQYVGFERLKPLWIGCKTGDGLEALGAAPLILGGSGSLGAVRRTLFKQLGLVPSVPDIGLLGARIVHAQFGRGGALALPIARALGVPLVVTYHGGDATKNAHYRPRLFPTIYQRRLEALKREAALFICVSEFIRRVLVERGFPAEKLKVIRYGVEIGPWQEPPPPERPYALFVGRFVEKKGASFLIQAMRILSERGRDLGLMMIGDGALAPQLKKEAEGLPNIEFLGWQENAAARRVMRSALALCVPSVTAESGDGEGLPNVILEAMAEATPVIGARSAGIAEAVENERTGLLIEPQNPVAIADALERLIERPGLRSTMGEAARIDASQKFDAAAQSHLLEETLLSTLER